MSDNSAANPPADQAAAIKSKEKLIQLNEELIDNCSTTSSSSGSDKLRIDIPEEAKEETSAKKTKPTGYSKREEAKSEEKIKVGLISLSIVIWLFKKKALGWTRFVRSLKRSLSVSTLIH